MATEDHDKAEIDHLTLYGKTFTWNTTQTGPVGRFRLEGIRELLDEINTLSRGNQVFEEGFAIFDRAYREESTLADATRRILDELLGGTGLVVLDPDQPDLKRSFAPVMEIDLLENAIGPAIEEKTLAMQALGWETAIPARETNFFLLADHNRYRIDRMEGGFKLQHTERIISDAEMKALIRETPELLSPNVALRPVYQEFILPNIAYVAGPGEVKYWLQLHGAFGVCNIPAPVLIPRYSIILLDQKITKWLAENALSESDLWLPEDRLNALMKQRLAGVNSLETGLSELHNLQEKLNATLYAQHNVELKEIKKQGDAYFKALKNAEKSFGDNVLNSPSNKAFMDKLTRYKHLYFNTQAPQEREQAFLQFFLSNTHFIEKISALPPMVSTCLFISNYDKE
jgi:bacillithiol biosynthesis cysteine-adding enzyme BshC